MLPPDLVIFDCDGVLVDSEPITADLLREDLGRRGLALSHTDIDQAFVGGTMRGIGKQAARMGADIPDNWVDLIYLELHRRLALGTPVIAGVESVIDRLDDAGVPYCVGSNGSLQKMQITLGQHPGLLSRLHGKLYSAHTLGSAKPDPDMFLKAAKDHGVAPARVAVIEDSPTGCKAARRAGMQGFGYAADDGGERLAAEGARVFHTMHDLSGLLSL